MNDRTRNNGLDSTLTDSRWSLVCKILFLYFSSRCSSPVNGFFAQKYYVDKNLYLIDLKAMVNEFVKPKGQRYRDKWRTFLPNRIVEEIMKFISPNGLGEDVFYWRKALDGNFTVKST